MTIPFDEAINQVQTQGEMQRYINRELNKNIRVQLPVEVISVDHIKQHCDLRILVKEKNQAGAVLPEGILPNVPIRYTNETGIAYIRLPVQIGDTGTVEFFDCSISQYKLQGIVEYHFDENYHSLESGVYTSGFYAEKNIYQLADVENTAIEIGTKQGTFKLHVDKLTGALTITAPVINFNSPIINMTGVTNIIGAVNITGATMVTGAFESTQPAKFPSVEVANGATNTFINSVIVNKGIVTGGT